MTIRAVVLTLACRRMRNRLRSCVRDSSPQLLRDHAVGPLDEADEDRRTAEARAVVREVGLRYAAGTRAGAAGEDRNLASGDFVERLAQRLPADRHDGGR